MKLKGFGNQAKASLYDNGLFISVIALGVSVVISALIMAVCGYNPIVAYSAIFTGAFGSLRGFAQVLTQATPLIFTGLAFTFAKKPRFLSSRLSATKNINPTPTADIYCKYG